MDTENSADSKMDVGGAACHAGVATPTNIEASPDSSMRLQQKQEEDSELSNPEIVD